MRAVRLVARCDKYDSTPGFVLKGVPPIDGMAAERSDGMLIAHDLFEHMNGVHNIGMVWDELEALGAIWQVRGRNGDLMTGSGYHSPQSNVASDVTRMFPDWLAENVYAPRIKRGYACDYDEDFDDIIRIAREDIWTEHNLIQDREFENCERYLIETKARMRLGFRKAWRKYGGGYRGANLFATVKRAVAEAVPMIDWEGQEFVLRYCEYEAVVTEAPENWQ